jgi:hypothetical protein
VPGFNLTEYTAIRLNFVSPRDEKSRICRYRAATRDKLTVKGAITGMRRDICAIAIGLLMVPFTAFSMDLMEDSEMDSVSASAEGSALISESTADHEMEDIDDRSFDFPTSGAIAAQSNADRESNNLGPGVSIYVYDVSFDLHILNISGGDTDGATVDMHR